VQNLDLKNGDGALPMGLVQHSTGFSTGRPFRQICVPFLPRLVWHTLQSVCSLNADWVWLHAGRLT
jgi:hypothetical protein